MDSQKNYYEHIGKALQSKAEFTVLNKTIYQSTRVKIEPGCYAAFFINMGDVLVTVDDFPLLPRLAAGLYGGYFGWGDNRKLTRKIEANVVFTAGGTDARCVITQMIIV